jgi:hypothetical protein
MRLVYRRNNKAYLACGVAPRLTIATTMLLENPTLSPINR